MIKRKLIMITSLIFLLCSTLTAFAAEPYGTEGFIERLYSTCLGRTPDSVGLAYWIDAMNNGEKSAAKVVSEFYASEEYQASGADDAAFVDSLYYTMMDRGSDAEGLAYWLDMLSSGVSRDYIISGFVGSKEFTIICDNYGVNRGSITLTEARDMNTNTTRFVQRLYNTCLSRTAEAEGLNYWCGYVNSGQISGALLSQKFFESPEYLSKDKGDASYVEDLYVTMMDRSSDAEGLNYWQVQLSYGFSRLSILKQFAESKEFTLICADYGINRGTIDEGSFQLSEELQLVNLINNERAKAGIPELIVDEYSNNYAEAYLTYEYVINSNIDFNGYIKGLNLTPDSKRVYVLSELNLFDKDSNSVVSAAKAFAQLDQTASSRSSFWGANSKQYTKIGVGAYVNKTKNGATTYWVLILSYEDTSAEPIPEPTEAPTEAPEETTAVPIFPEEPPMTDAATDLTIEPTTETITETTPILEYN